MKRISEEEFINDIFNIINEDKTEKPKNLIQEDNFENKIIENNRLFVVDTENTNNYSFINNFKVNENGKLNVKLKRGLIFSQICSKIGKSIKKNK